MKNKTSAVVLRSSLLGMASLMLVSSCSTTAKRVDEPAETVYQKICQQPEEVEQVTGNVWVKIDGPRGKGQFPATVLYERSPSQKLILQVTDLIGTPVSELTIDSQGMRVKGEGAKLPWIKKSIESQALLGLKPLTLLSLFSGRTLCPHTTTRVYWSENELVAEMNKSVSYRYGVEKWGDRTLVTSTEVAGLKIEFM
ncbi:MAG: hypothetical protein EOP09_17895, partial [Proteobacteria bacterium]